VTPSAGPPELRLVPIPTALGPPGTVPVEVRGTDPEGRPVHLRPADGPGPVLLLFLSTDCLGCGPLWDLADDPGGRLGAVSVVVLVRRRAESAAAAAKAGSGAVVVAPEAFTDYRTPGSPAFALVVPGRATVAAEGTAAGVAQVVDCVRAALAEGGGGGH
jgi:hypothetical protein